MVALRCFSASINALLGRWSGVLTGLESCPFRKRFRMSPASMMGPPVRTHFKVVPCHWRGRFRGLRNKQFRHTEVLQPINMLGLTYAPHNTPCCRTVRGMNETWVVGERGQCAGRRDRTFAGVDALDWCYLPARQSPKVSGSSMVALRASSLAQLVISPASISSRGRRPISPGSRTMSVRLQTVLRRLSEALNRTSMSNRARQHLVPSAGEEPKSLQSV